MLQCIHNETGLKIHLAVGVDSLTLTGHPILVKAMREQLDTFKNSYALRGDIVSAMTYYGDLFTRTGSIGSVNTNSERFLTDFLLPDMIEMGYTCKVVYQT